MHPLENPRIINKKPGGGKRKKLSNKNTGSKKQRQHMGNNKNELRASCLEIFLVESINKKPKQKSQEKKTQNKEKRKEKSVVMKRRTESLTTDELDL
jgi:hypothetical protein